MLISETSKVSVLYVTAKFSRKSNFSAKVLSSIDITSPNIFVSTIQRHLSSKTAVGHYEVQQLLQ